MKKEKAIKLAVATAAVVGAISTECYLYKKNNDLQDELTELHKEYNEVDKKRIDAEEKNSQMDIEIETLLINADTLKKTLEDTQTELEEARQQSAVVVEEEPTVQTYTASTDCLTPSKGVHYGVSGKETYYNLDMSGVVSIMRSMGNNDPYWVREDGVKMLGGYVMVAADFNIRPRGSLIETSLGTGIVCDTGGFAASNPTQLDIATTW